MDIKNKMSNWLDGTPDPGVEWHIKGNIDPTAKITVPTSELPEFKIEIPNFTLTCDNPADHVKAMISSNRYFSTGENFSVKVDMAVYVYGTNNNPFGIDQDDPRLGSGAIALIDDSTGVVANFEISNSKIFALRELFIVNAPRGDSGVVNPLCDTCLLDMQIEPGSWHRYEIHYYPGNDGILTPGPDRFEWIIDSKLVREVEWVATIDPPLAPVIKPSRFRVNMAIFTLLDDLPDGKGGIISGVDPEYKQSIFGQGVISKWRNLEICTGGKIKLNCF